MRLDYGDRRPGHEVTLDAYQGMDGSVEIELGSFGGKCTRFKSI